MHLRYDDERDLFIFDCSYYEKDVAKAAGFRWLAAEKVWSTSSPETASKLVAFADEGCKTTLLQVREKQVALVAASRATDAEIDVPAPNGLSYMPFQRAGIAYAIQRPSTLIADEMGLGKTIQAIGVLNAMLHRDPNLKPRVLVICPASLKFNWRRELDKWLIRKQWIMVADSQRAPFLSEGSISIINYDILAKHSRALRAVQWDLLIVDEAHYVKNSKTIRSKEVNAIRAKRCVFLTGTPIVNRPIELWPIISRLDPATFNNYMAFAKRYCGAYQGKFGWDMKGSRNLDELQDLLRRTIMVRRLKKDVLTDLPPKTRQVIDVSIPGSSRVIEAERAKVNQLADGLEKIKAEVELAKAASDPRIYAAAVQQLRAAARAAFTELSRLRHDTALAKVPAVIEHVKEALEGGGKVVVMAHHHDVQDALKEAFGKMAVIHRGGMSDEEKDAAVVRFHGRPDAGIKDDPECRVFLGSILASGVGITLTIASHVVFAELDWVPGNMTQAEDRCHRIGQTDNVLVQHLVIDGSIDAKVARTLVEKQAVIDQALDAEKDELKEQPVTPEEEPAATHGVTRQRIHEEGMSLDPDLLAAIHEGLRILAELCDGANARDGQGFNRLDSRIGKSLAAEEHLSRAQGALGRRVIMKYQRQLPDDLVKRLTPSKAA